MGCRPELDLIKRLKQAGISRRDLSNTLNRNYSTIVSWLNGYCKLPDDYRDFIEQMIEDRQVVDEI